MSSSTKTKVIDREWPESFPRVVADLNLDFPALIEASAGTGKTYAIEHLVLRLVAEKPEWKFESLLLLSFTEKTAGDLRRRIRERLKIESRNLFWTAEERARFFEAHLRCDEASIHTLHGFCHAVLRNHALENGTLFDSEVADDRGLLKDALDGLLRGEWAHDEPRLRDLLTALSEEAPSDWRNHLVSIALAYQPGRGDAVSPNITSSRLSEQEAELDRFAKELRTANTAFNGKLPKGIFIRVRDKLQQLSSSQPADRLKSLTEFFLGIRKNNKAVKDGFVACLSKTLAKDPQAVIFAEACQRFYNAAKRWEEEKRLHALSLIAEAARELRGRLVWEKKRQGVLSYDDMVLRLLEAVRARPALVEQLCERYHACVVDEFQDTDPMQWELLHRLCLDGEKKLPLFLVGDPKQAIYGFRGGDLRTYLEARSRLHDMAIQGKAQGVGLKENFRSLPQLIHALNATFAQPVWFDLSDSSEASKAWQLPAPSDRIPFTLATVPAKTDAPDENNASIILRDFSDCKSKSDAQRSVYNWIANFIGAISLTPNGGMEGAPLQNSFADFAVLTRTNTEALAVERHLRRCGIPCRVRRRGGVFDSLQADQLRLLLGLLESVNDPRSQSQILLLPFLRVGKGGWPRGLPEECPEPIRRWAALAEAGQWPEFFHSVLYETGFLYRLAAETRGGSEVQTLLHLVRTLTEEGAQNGHSLRGLLQRFDARRGGEGEDTGETSDDGNENRVTIMTLHLSKGLEFPVVFLASLSDSRKPAFYTLRGENGFRHVLDKEDAEAIAAYQRQQLDEDKRLFYVALTRAKQSLHIPLLPEKFSRTGSGPLGGFAAQALRAASQEHLELFRIDSEPLPETLPRMKIESKSAESPAAEFPDRDPWEEAGAFFQDRKRRLSSYSQLLKREAATVVEEDGRRVDREEGETQSVAAEIETEIVTVEILKADPNTIPLLILPPGVNTGNALHELFETVDFADVGTASNPEALLLDPVLVETVKRILRLHGLSEEYALAALTLVWNTLRMPLPDPAGGDAFQLAFIADRKHEMEFLFPAPPPGPQRGEGFLWGFMDLIFRHEDRYYLLDWKSNFLERYGENDIKADMNKHNYHLQYQLYAVAMDKWLRARLPAYDFKKHFGGIYYLYLRAASVDRFSGFVHRPKPEELSKDYPAHLLTVLGLKPEPKGARK